MTSGPTNQNVWRGGFMLFCKDVLKTSFPKMIELSCKNMFVAGEEWFREVR